MYRETGTSLRQGASTARLVVVEVGTKVKVLTAIDAESYPRLKLLAVPEQVRVFRGRRRIISKSVSEFHSSRVKEMGSWRRDV